jgi:hypothetical protein
MAITGVFGSASAITGTTIGVGAGSQGSCVSNKDTSIYTNAYHAINACVIPGGTVGPGGYIDVKFEFSQSCSAATTTGAGFYFVLGGYTAGPTTIIPAANKSYRGSIRIRNVDNNSQIVTPMAGDGGTSVALTVISANLAIDQSLKFFTGPGETGSNSVALKGWSVDLHKVSSTATAVGLTGTNAFYGINHHFTYGSTPSKSDIISAMAVLKLNTIRVDWYGRSHSAGGIDNTTWITDLASAMHADGRFNMMLLCGLGTQDGAGVTFASETAAYNYWYDQGSYIAALTKPLGVVLYEMGNEIDSVSELRDLVVTQGTYIGDFSKGGTNMPTWNAWVGAQRGLYAGIKSVHTAAQVGSNAFTNASIWCSDALWEGAAPDGTLGHNPVRWDWTNWHLYTEGDATNVDYSGNPGAKFNLLKYIHNAYGKPIFLTEFNPAQSTASSQTIVVQWLSTWYALQNTLNIGGVVFYDWFDSPYQYCNASSSPSVPNSVGAAMTAFISANPALK